MRNTAVGKQNDHERYSENVEKGKSKVSLDPSFTFPFDVALPLPEISTKYNLWRQGRWKYVFELASAANEINQLTKLVESARSAIVKRPQSDSGPVQVIVSPEDFDRFHKKSEALNVYRSHSSQCIDLKMNELSRVPATPSTPRYSRAWTKLKTAVRTKEEGSPIGLTTRSIPKTIQEFGDECTGKTKSRKESMNESLPNMFENTLKAPAPTGPMESNNQTVKKISVSPTVRYGLTTSRTSRVSNATTKQSKKKKNNLKSKEKPVGKAPKGKACPKSNGKKKLAKNRDPRRNENGKAKAESNIVHRTTMVIPFRVTSTLKPSPKLMSMVSKSLKKTSLKNPPTGNENFVRSVAPGKSSSQVDSNKGHLMKNVSLKETKGREVEYKQKILATTNFPITQSPKSGTKLRTTRQHMAVLKPMGARKSTLFSNPAIKKITIESVEEERNRKRSSRDLKDVERGFKCGLKMSQKTKRANWHYIRKDFGPYTPMGCHIIKITNLCKSDTSESGETLSIEPSVPKELSPVQPDLLPGESPELFPYDAQNESPDFKGSPTFLPNGPSDLEPSAPVDLIEEPLSQFPGEQMDFPSGSLDTQSFEELVEAPDGGEEDVASIEIPDRPNDEPPFMYPNGHQLKPSESLPSSGQPGESLDGVEHIPRPDGFSPFLPDSSIAPHLEQPLDTYPIVMTESSVIEKSLEQSAQHSPESNNEAKDDVDEDDRKENGDNEDKRVENPAWIAPETEQSEININAKSTEIVSNPSKSLFNIQEDNSVNNEGVEKNNANDEGNEDEDEDYDDEDYDDNADKSAEIVDYVDEHGNTSRSDVDDYELDEE